MSKVLFSIQYEIVPEKRDEYLKVIKELKNLLKAEGLESYVVYEVIDLICKGLNCFKSNLVYIHVLFFGILITFKCVAQLLYVYGNSI